MALCESHTVTVAVDHHIEVMGIQAKATFPLGVLVTSVELRSACIHHVLVKQCLPVLVVLVPPGKPLEGWSRWGVFVLGKHSD